MEKVSVTVTESSQHIRFHKIMMKIVSRKGFVRLPHLQTHKKTTSEEEEEEGEQGSTCQGYIFAIW